MPSIALTPIVAHSHRHSHGPHRHQGEKLELSPDARSLRVRGREEEVSMDDVLAIAFVLMRDVLPKDVTAFFRFNMYAEKSRDRVLSQVLIVKRAASLELTAWMSWMRIVLGLLPLFLLVSMLIGPLSAAIGTFCILRMSDVIVATFQERCNVPKPELMYWFNVVAALAVFLFFAVWIGILISWLPSLALSGLTVALLFRQFHQDPDGFLQWRLHEYPTPKLTYPIEVFYDQDDMHAMFTFRNAIFKHHRARVALVSTGSYIVEALCSMILPSPVYNSPRMRSALHYFLGYFMPVIFAFKFAFIVYPLTLHSWLSYFWKDAVIGFVGVLLTFVLSIFQFILHGIYLLFGGDNGPFVVFTYISNNTSLWWAYFMHSVGFVLSIDEGLVYFRTKTREFVTIFSPLIAMGTQAFNALVTGPFKFVIELIVRTVNANANLGNLWAQFHRLKYFLKHGRAQDPMTPSRADDSIMSVTPGTETTLESPPDTDRAQFNASPTSTLRKRSRLNVVETAPTEDFLPQAQLGPVARTSSTPPAQSTIYHDGAVSKKND